MTGTHKSDIITINMFSSMCLKILFIFVENILRNVSSAMKLNCRKRIYTKYFTSLERIGKMSPLQARLWPRGWVEVLLYSSMTAALEVGEWPTARPGRTFPPGKTRYPFYRRLDGGVGLDGRKISPHWDSILGPFSPWSVAISTDLPGPIKWIDLYKIHLRVYETTYDL